MYQVALSDDLWERVEEDVIPCVGAGGLVHIMLLMVLKLLMQCSAFSSQISSFCW